tara:strand:- start:4865 stop:5998 length:1134 start_codon:yes stop_codon:yes gene_type:complete
MIRKAPFLLFLLWSLVGTMHAETWAYIGTYTKGDSEGIYRSTLDLTTGQLSAPQLAAETKDPSFVVIHPNGQYLYSVSEIATGNGKKTGSVSAFSIDTVGDLTLLNQQPTGGAHPCHVSMDSLGKSLLVANYSGGNCTSYPIADDGSIGEAGSTMQHEGSSVDPRRQEGPHAHSINVDPADRRAFAADLGLDKILIYDLDPTSGKLTPSKQPFLQTPPGGGPRHLSFHPSGKFAFANLEMTLEVAAIAYDASSGTMELLDTYPTVPEGTPQKGNSTAETLVHPSGRFLYVSNRGPNSIAVFEIDESTGSLTPVERESTQGEIPRGFGIDPSGQFLVVGNQRSHNVVVLKINQETGALEPTGSEIAVDSPVNVRFLVR